jgi:hypothetical protein
VLRMPRTQSSGITAWVENPFAHLQQQAERSSAGRQAVQHREALDQRGQVVTPPRQPRQLLHRVSRLALHGAKLPIIRAPSCSLQDRLPCLQCMPTGPLVLLVEVDSMYCRAAASLLHLRHAC